MADERTCSSCGEKTERVGPGKQFTLPVVNVEYAGSTETHSIGRGVAVDVYRCAGIWRSGRRLRRPRALCCGSQRNRHIPRSRWAG